MNNININKNSTQSGRSLLSKCAGYTQYFLSDVYTNSTQTKKAQVETVQCGRSMIEMLGVLAIVGVLSVGGIAGYSKAMEKFKINKTIDQVSHIVANVRTLYAQQTTYEGLNSLTALQMGILPDSLNSSNLSELSYTPSEYGFTNAFGGTLSLVSNNEYQWSPNEQYFTISISAMTKENCIALASYDWGDESSTGLSGISIALTPNSITYYTGLGSVTCAGDGYGGINCLRKPTLTEVLSGCTGTANAGYEGAPFINLTFK